MTEEEEVPKKRVRRKSAAQIRREEDSRAAQPNEEGEIIHGDVIEHPDGSLDVVNPIAPNKDLTAREKQRTAMNLKMMGASYQTIADQLGYASASGAHAAVKTGSEAALRDSAVDLRNMTYMQLQQILMVWWPKAIKGDGQATAIVLQIMDRVRQLFALDGLPVGEEILADGVLTISGDKDNYIEAMRKMRQSKQKEL